MIMVYAFFNVLPYLWQLPVLVHIFLGIFFIPIFSLSGVFWGFFDRLFSLFTYEPKEPLTQVINYLNRHDCIALWFTVSTVAAYLPIQAQPLLVISRLKQFSHYLTVALNLTKLPAICFNYMA